MKTKAQVAEEARAYEREWRKPKLYTLCWVENGQAKSSRTYKGMNELRIIGSMKARIQKCTNVSIVGWDAQGHRTLEERIN